MARRKASTEKQSETSAALRKRAEGSLGNLIAKAIPSLTSENVQALVRELRIHQIELELQNEELRRAQQEAEESRDQYYDLYEGAPSANLTLDRQLRIKQVNEATERLLGATRAVLVGRRLYEFVDADQAPEFMEVLRTSFQRSEPLTYEVTLRHKDGVRTALVNMCLVGPSEGTQHLRLAATDITERRVAETRLQAHERALRESQHELQVLSGRLLSMEQDVREGVARDLEEEYRQRMAVLIWELSALEHGERLSAHVLEGLPSIRRISRT